MAGIDRQKQQRDIQIHVFIRKTLIDLLRADPPNERTRADLNKLICMTPEEKAYARKVMRIFREEDR